MASTLNYILLTLFTLSFKVFSTNFQCKGIAKSPWMWHFLIFVLSLLFFARMYTMFTPSLKQIKKPIANHICNGVLAHQYWGYWDLFDLVFVWLVQASSFLFIPPTSLDPRSLLEIFCILHWLEWYYVGYHSSYYPSIVYSQTFAFPHLNCLVTTRLQKCFTLPFEMPLSQVSFQVPRNCNRDAKTKYQHIYCILLWKSLLYMSCWAFPSCSRPLNLLVCRLSSSLQFHHAFGVPSNMVFLLFLSKREVSFLDILK